MLDFEKLIDPAWLFEKTPSFPFKFLLPLLIFFGLMFLAGILVPLWISKKNKKTPPYQKLASKLQTPLIIFALIGFLILFFRWQAIPYLSTRILIIILLLSIIFWLTSFLQYIKRGFQKELGLWQEELRKMKYLPVSRKDRK